MTNMKLKLSIALAVICTAIYVAYLEVQASDESDELISATAVWSPSDQELAQLNKTCESDPQAYSDCFISHMPDLGASEEAVAFTRNYAAQNHGSIAILTGFHPMDEVDLGYVYFPAGKERKQGWFLLNGYPLVVNVDDQARIPESAMEKQPLWATIHRQHPAIKLYFQNAERSTDKTPEAETLPDGSQRFIVEYPLRDGCASCAVLGHAAFSFDFDPSGELVTVRFVTIKQSDQSAAQPSGAALADLQRWAPASAGRTLFKANAPTICCD